MDRIIQKPQTADVLETHLISIVSVFLISVYYYNFITSVVNDRYVLQTD